MGNKITPPIEASMQTSVFSTEGSRGDHWMISELHYALPLEDSYDLDRGQDENVIATPTYIYDWYGKRVQTGFTTVATYSRFDHGPLEDYLRSVYYRREHALRSRDLFERRLGRSVANAISNAALCETDSVVHLDHVVSESITDLGLVSTGLMRRFFRQRR